MPDPLELDLGVGSLPSVLGTEIRSSEQCSNTSHHSSQVSAEYTLKLEIMLPPGLFLHS